MTQKTVETVICCQCKLLFPKPPPTTFYNDWCDQCIEEIEIPALNRFPKATPEEIAEDKARQERTRQSLKQRALDRKNGIGKTTLKKSEQDDRPLDDSLIFNQTDK